MSEGAHDDCAVEGCGRLRKRTTRTSRSRYCPTHFARWRKYRDLYEDVPVQEMQGRLGRMTLPELRAELESRT